MLHLLPDAALASRCCTCFPMLHYSSAQFMCVPCQVHVCMRAKREKHGPCRLRKTGEAQLRAANNGRRGCTVLRSSALNPCTMDGAHDTWSCKLFSRHWCAIRFAEGQLHLRSPSSPVVFSGGSFGNSHFRWFRISPWSFVSQGK